jgi:hypothetical protein
VKTIWKYKLDIRDYQIIEIPRLDQIQVLSVANQNEEIVMYAIVDNAIPKDQIKNVDVRIFGTGHQMVTMVGTPTVVDMRFVGTVKLHSGQLMFHVFVKE